MHLCFIVLAALSPVTRELAISFGLGWLRSWPQDTQAGSYTDSPAKQIVFNDLILRRPIGQVIRCVSFLFRDQGLIEDNGLLSICPLFIV